MLASPRLPNKSHSTGIFIANKGISNHNKDNGKAMLKNWTKGGWKPGTWSVHRGPALPSRLPSSSIRSSRLGSTSILHLVQFLLRPSTVSAVAWFAFVWTIENCGCVKHCCRWAHSCPTVLESGNTRLAPRYCASNQCAPHMLLMVWWPIPNITGWNLYFILLQGKCVHWGWFWTIAKVFFSRKN